MNRPQRTDTVVFSLRPAVPEQPKVKLPPLRLTTRGRAACWLAAMTTGGVLSALAGDAITHPVAHLCIALHGVLPWAS